MRMCSNPACPEHGQPTKLLGGCDCGAALVPYEGTTDEPSNDQLANLIVTFAQMTPEVPPIEFKTAKHILDNVPSVREAWLVRHRELQTALRRN